MHGENMEKKNTCSVSNLVVHTVTAWPNSMKIPQLCAITCHGRVKDKNVRNRNTALLPQK